MRPFRRFAISCLLSLMLALAARAVPIAVDPVTAPHGMVVAGHPEAAEIGAEVLRSGGNAIDAAVAVSLALGVAEPYGSGLGGKLMLLFHEAKTGRTYAVDAMDEASRTLDPAEFRRRDAPARTDGWGAVAVPGLAAGLFTAHGRWGVRPWAEDVRPAIELARRGFLVLPKTCDFFEERIDKLRGDADLQRHFLPDGQLPAAGSRLANEALAQTMELLARHGADGFYRGPVAEAIVAASRAGGGMLTSEDFAAYRARIVEPYAIDFRGYRIVSGPAPATGSALFLPILKALETEPLRPPLRTVENLDLIGRVWREVLPEMSRTMGDSPDAAAQFGRLVSPAFIAQVRQRAHAAEQGRQAAFVAEPESVFASTTHFAVVDREGNVVCATQSQSLHFGAGVMAAGVVMNDSLSNFSVFGADGPNSPAPGRRPRSTISPTLVLRDGKPLLAIGIPGSARIPTAVLQGLVDILVFGRSPEEAIGDTRVHWFAPFAKNRPEALEAEGSLPAEVVAGMRSRGWAVELKERPGTGRQFGGLNIITLNADGTRTGYADPRRTNAAAGH